jgi:hypothetical protein
VAVLAAFTLRSLLEMTPAPAYAASVVALALVADARASRLVPVFTLLGLAAFWTSQPALNGASGWPRIMAHLALLAVAAITVLKPRPTETTKDAASGNPVTWRTCPWREHRGLSKQQPGATTDPYARAVRLSVRGFLVARFIAMVAWALLLLAGYATYRALASHIDNEFVGS